MDGHARGTLDSPNRRPAAGELRNIETDTGKHVSDGRSSTSSRALIHSLQIIGELYGERG